MGAWTVWEGACGRRPRARTRAGAGEPERITRCCETRWCACPRPSRDPRAARTPATCSASTAAPRRRWPPCSTASSGASTWPTAAPATRMRSARQAAVQALLEAADEALERAAIVQRAARRGGARGRGHRHRHDRRARAPGARRRLDRRQRRRRRVGHRDRRGPRRGGDLGHRLERLRRRRRRAHLARGGLGPSARRRGLRLLAGRAVDQGGAARPRGVGPADGARRRRSGVLRGGRASRRSPASSTPSR